MDKKRFKFEDYILLDIPAKMMLALFIFPVPLLLPVCIILSVIFGSRENWPLIPIMFAWAAFGAFAIYHDEKES